MKVNSIRINAIEGPISREFGAEIKLKTSNTFRCIHVCNVVRSVQVDYCLFNTHSLFEYVDRVCVCVFFDFACRLFAKSFIDTKFRLDHPVSTSHRLLLQFNSVRCHSVSSSKLFSLRIICIHIFQSVFSLSRSLSGVSF